MVDEVAQVLPGPAGAERLADASTPGGGTPGTGGNGREPARSAPARPRSRGQLGAGLVEVPWVEVVDPAAAIMSLPEVPEAHRFCSLCDAEVGRGRGGLPGPVVGRCDACRHPFSFVPNLHPGDLVAGQYRVVGCLAYGGLGWIYLAQDERVSHRWVVLKGMLDLGDPVAMSAALAERQFLARVEHPNVVRIYNFVQHAGAGYIVMEYVGGKTLWDVLDERRRAAGGEPNPLPVELAIAYVLGILPAFRYLHGLGLVYNDLKAENVMLQGEDVKLIDLGATTRLDDHDAVVYGTDGYQAPEVPSRGVSIASDLYSIARCLAVLALDFSHGQAEHRHRLPAPEQRRVLREHDSFHRFLRKGTAERPADRFQSADEMAEQLYGVLREVVAVARGTWVPATSTLFGGDLHPLHAAADAAGPRSDWRHLPAVTVDPADAAAGFVLHVTRLGDPALQVAMLREAADQGRMPDTTEARLGLARAHIEAGDQASAERCLARIESGGAGDWRVSWYRGLSLLARGRAADAMPEFERVYSSLPGELAPKLALALAAERSGDPRTAARFYEVVAATDPGYTSAAFGLARVREAQGDWRGAVAAYAAVAPTSSLHVEAQLALARTLIGGPREDRGVHDLARASEVIEKLALDERRRAELAVELLEAALGLLQSGRVALDGRVVVLGLPLLEVPLRLGLERAYRVLAVLATRQERIRLVDRANQVRPPTRR
jgi:serine/threonine-protein kinase PknG